MPLTRLVYYSENQIDPTSGSVVAELQKILSASKRNNKPKNITGALVFDDLWFLQVLEGEREEVWATFERIGDDDRHGKVTLVEMRDVEHRMFANWWMGVTTRNHITQGAFSPYLVDGRLRPQRLSAQEILALMVDVSKFGLERDLAASAA